MAHDNRPVLIAYDGSEHSRAAVEKAAGLLPGADAVVVSTWESVRPAGGIALIAMPADVAEQAIAKLDQADEQAALDRAEEGARLARESGLEARARAVRCERTTWRTIIDAADEHDARLVVVGSRGRSGIATALLGSVSHGVVQHSTRPVLIVTADSD